MIKTAAILNKDTIYNGFFKIVRLTLHHSLYRGGYSPVLTRELLERDNAVAIVLYDPDKNAVVMVEQFRIGALEMKDGAWLTELVAGMVGPNEDPADVAVREAKEEAGVTLANLQKIGNYLLSSGGCNEQASLFYGEVDSTQADGIHGLDCEGEDIKVVVLPAEQAFAEMDKGRFPNAITVIGLQWLRRTLGR